MEHLEEICEGIYRIEVPLPNNPLKSINSYVIKGECGLFVIDTGLGNETCESVWLHAISEIENPSGRIDFFITHMHADHSGLLSRVSKEDSRIYISKEDAPFITATLNWDKFWQDAEAFALKYGFPKELSKEAIKKHPGYLFGLKERPAGSFQIVGDGDLFIVGDKRLEVIKTPGHTPGHLCLYDKVNNFLFSGDHVLSDITPNISAGEENPNPLAEYLRNLQKIKELSVKLVLPGHRKPFKELNSRIEEIEKHHEIRLNEIILILEELKRATAYEIASRMSWDIGIDSFDEFPVSQKWFAHGEAIAHLLYLEQQGRVVSKEENGIVIFQLKTS